jgi:hypothetical protein
VERVEGYVKTLEKSTSPVLSFREVFEYGTESYKGSWKRLEAVLKVLSFV